MDKLPKINLGEMMMSSRDLKLIWIGLQALVFLAHS